MLRLAVGTGGGGVPSSRPRSASLAFPAPAPHPSEPGDSHDGTAHTRAAAGKGGDAVEAAVGVECREAGRTPCAVGGGPGRGDLWAANLRPLLFPNASIWGLLSCRRAGTPLAAVPRPWELLRGAHTPLPNPDSSSEDPAQARGRRA